MINHAARYGAILGGISIALVVLFYVVSLSFLGSLKFVGLVLLIGLGLVIALMGLAGVSGYGVWRRRRRLHQQLMNAKVN